MCGSGVVLDVCKPFLNLVFRGYPHVGNPSAARSSGRTVRARSVIKVVSGDKWVVKGDSRAVMGDKQVVSSTGKRNYPQKVTKRWC